MQKLLLLAILALLQLELTACQTLFVANQSSDTVDFVDLNSTSLDPAGAVAGTFATPREVAITPDGRYAFVTNQNGDSLAMIDTSTLSVIDTISLVTAMNPSPVVAIGVVANMTTAFVTSNSNITLTVVDIASRSAVATVVLGLIGNANEIAFSADGSQVWITNTNQSEVYVVDTATYALLATIPLTGSTPNGIALTSTHAYVVNQATNDLSKINVSTFMEESLIPLGGGVSQPQDIVISPDGTTAYIVDLGSNALYFYSLATDSITGSVPLPVSQNYGVTITPDGADVYVSHYSSNQISRYEIATGLITSSGTVYGMPLGMGLYCPNQISGSCEKNVFLTQIEYVNLLEWNPIASAVPVVYLIYRNGEQIGVVSGNGPYRFSDPNRKKGTTDVYEIYAQTADNLALVGAVSVRSCR